MKELENCPFCPNTIGELEHNSGSHGYFSPSYFCSCPKCGHTSEGVKTDWERVEYSLEVEEEIKQQAIKAWNTRAQTKREAELTATIESMRITNLALGAKAKGLEFDKGELVKALEGIKKEAKSGMKTREYELACAALSNHKQQEADHAE